MNAFATLWRLFRHPEERQHLLRTALLGAIMVAAIAAEAAVVWFFAAQLLADLTGAGRILLVVAVAVLPVVALCAWARLPSGQSRLARRYIIRPITFLKSNSPYTGSAIAAALSFELNLMSPNVRNGATGPESATVSLPYVSLPLTWLWSKTRALLTGSKDVVIEGLLIDTDKTPRLKLWVTNEAVFLESELSEGPFYEALNAVLRPMARDLLQRLDPRQLGLMFWDQQNFEGAVRLLSSEPPSQTRDIGLANLYLAGDDDEIARLFLDAAQAKRVVNSRRWRLESGIVRALIDAKVGQYRTSRHTLNQLHACVARFPARARDADMRGLVLQEADCLLSEMKYENAIDSFGKAEAIALRELRRDANLGPNARLADCLDHFRLAPNERSGAVLTDLARVYAGRAAANRLNGSDPMADYRAQMEVLDCQRPLVWGSTLADVFMASALVYKSAARARSLEEDLQPAIELFTSARDMYSEAASQLEVELQRFNDDMKAFTSHVWCRMGRMTCTRGMLLLTEWPELEAGLQGCVDAMHAIERQLQDDEARADFRQSWLHSVKPTGTMSTDPRHDLIQAAVACNIALLSRMPASASTAAQMLQRAVDALASDQQQADAEALTAAFDRSHLAHAPDEDTAVRRELFEATVAVLDAVRKHPRHEDVGPALTRADWLHMIEDDEQYCLGAFHRLRNHGHRRHVAEGAYGMACLHAILVDALRHSVPDYVDGVFWWLDAAIKSSQGAKPNSSGLIGRGRTDGDFDCLREHPVMQTLLVPELPGERESELEAEQVAS